MRKPVYVVIRVLVEAGSWRERKSAAEFAGACNYSLTMPPETGYAVVSTEVVAGLDKLYFPMAAGEFVTVRYYCEQCSKHYKSPGAFATHKKYRHPKLL